MFTIISYSTLLNSKCLIKVKIYLFNVIETYNFSNYYLNINLCF